MDDAYQRMKANKSNLQQKNGNMLSQVSETKLGHSLSKLKIKTGNDLMQIQMPSEVSLINQHQGTKEMISESDKLVNVNIASSSNEDQNKLAQSNSSGVMVLQSMSKLYEKTEKHAHYKQREALIKIGQQNSARKILDGQESMNYDVTLENKTRPKRSERMFSKLDSNDEIKQPLTLN